MATRVVLTYADLVALPADGKRYELHEGEIYVTASPRPRHQMVVGNLYIIITEHVRRLGLGDVFVSPIDVILTEVNVLVPDLKRQLAAKYGVPHYWIVDADARAIETYHLMGTSYEAGPRLEGDMPAALPPFTDLLFESAAVWR